MYDIIVTFKSSEWEAFNPLHSEPPTREVTYEDNATTLRRSGVHSRTSIEPPTQKRRIPQPKKVLYKCKNYRVENGVLVLEENSHGNNGYIIPLGAIQEIKVDTVGTTFEPNDVLTVN